MSDGFLLDTHSLLWWWTDARRLGSSAYDRISSGSERIIVSVANVWEIAIKSAAGRLDEIEDFRRDYGPLMKENGFDLLAITDEHAMAAGFLPGTHRDPFDRLIAAQALVEDLTVITRDRQLAALGCKTLW